MGLSRSQPNSQILERLTWHSSALQRRRLPLNLLVVFLVFGTIINHDVKVPFSGGSVLLLSTPIYRGFLYN